MAGSPGSVGWLDRGARWIEGRGIVAAMVLALAAFAVYAWLAGSRDYASYYIENDFEMFYVSDARLIQQGDAPEAVYHGPGYPLVLAAVEPLTGDFFVAGRWIAVAAIPAAGLALYAVARQLLPVAGALAAEAVFFASHHISIQAMTASTDALALAFMMGSLAVLLWRRPPAVASAGLAGALAGYACLVRYNSVFLLAVGALAILALDVYSAGRVRGRLGLTAVFLGTAFVVAVPWLTVNWAANGSPLESSNHLQVATYYIGDNHNLDGVESLRDDYGSLPEVVLHDPLAFSGQYVVTVFKHGLHTGYFEFNSSLVGLAAMVGAAGLVLTRGDRRGLVIVLTAVLFVAVAALTHWEDRYFVTIAALYAVLAAVACWRLPGWLSARGWRLPEAFTMVAAGVLLVSSLALSSYYVPRFLDLDHPERLAVCPFFEARGLEDELVVARRAHITSACGQRGYFFPLVTTPEALEEALAGTGATYLLYGEIERELRPELAPVLGDPAAAPDWLEPVWSSADGRSQVYRIR